VLALHAARVQQLASQLGPGQPVCHLQGSLAGRQWQLPEYYVYVIPAADASAVELEYHLGRPGDSPACPAGLGRP